MTGVQTCALPICEWSWGTPIDETDDTSVDGDQAVQLDDMIACRMDATVVQVFTASATVETAHGLKFTVGIPDGETLVADDLVEIILTFEGNQDENQWFLVDVVFGQKIIEGDETNGSV